VPTGMFLRPASIDFHRTSSSGLPIRRRLGESSTLISHHHKCIFVHIPKCGGTSVERIFVDAVGLSWTQRAPLLLRKRVDGELGPPRLAHLTAREYVTSRHVPEAMFEEYLKFAVVRHPAARIVSIYESVAFDRIMSFERFTMRFLPRVLADPGHPWRYFLRPQAEFITDASGQVIVDRLLNLEEIDAQLPCLLRQLGINVVATPHENRSGPLSVGRIARLRWRYVRAHRAVPTMVGRHEVTWTDAIHSAVVDAYRDDFRILGLTVD
jgi:hypothetical protein